MKVKQSYLLRNDYIDSDHSDNDRAKVYISYILPYSSNDVTRNDHKLHIAREKTS